MAEEHQGHRDGRSIPDLIRDLSQDVVSLLRGELRMAQLELAEKAKGAGVGAGAFAAAGVLAWFGLGLFLTAAVLGLAYVLPAWASAMVVGGVVFLAAGAASLVGKSKISAVKSPVPGEAIDGVREDVETVKEGFRR